MKKKLLFSDIDGTLIKSNGTIDPELANKLSELANHGHGLILSSGRPLDGILPVQAYLEEMIHTRFEDAYIISNNGALIYDCNAHEAIFEKCVSLQMVDTLQSLAKDYHIHIQTYTQKEIVCEQRDDELAHYTSRIKLPVITTDRFTNVLTRPPYKMLSIGLSGQQEQMEFKKYIDTHFSDEVITLFSRDEYMEIIHKDAGKGNALRYLCQHLNVPIENSYAAGDLENDISMITAAGTGFAMANGDDKVKSSANYITQRNCEHAGLIEVIDYMLSN